jgi:hypothetical protein
MVKLFNLEFLFLCFLEFKIESYLFLEDLNKIKNILENQFYKI